MSVKQEHYRFPKELEPYRPYMRHAGREEELMSSPATPFNNVVLFGMRSEMAAQLGLLNSLQKAGLLRPVPAPTKEA